MLSDGMMKLGASTNVDELSDLLKAANNSSGGTNVATFFNPINTLSIQLAQVCACGHRVKI